MRSTVEKADNESVPISVVQPPSNEIVMDLIDIGEYPELEPSLEFPNTPLYISDDEDFDTAQGFTDLDKVGVKKFIVDAFPLLYQPLGTLKDTAYSSDRIAFISASGYVIRCQPVHWASSIRCVIFSTPRHANMSLSLLRLNASNSPKSSSSSTSTSSS